MLLLLLLLPPPLLLLLLVAVYRHEPRHEPQTLVILERPVGVEGPPIWVGLGVGLRGRVRDGRFASLSSKKQAVRSKQ